MTTKKYFTHLEALETILNLLTLGYDTYYSDLHHYAFSEDYYIVGTYEATQALEQFGTFDAIEKVREYEVDNFGLFNTEIYPEKIANMLFYIIGYEAMELEPFNDFYNQVYDQLADDETNALLIEKINETIAALESEVN